MWRVVSWNGMSWSMPEFKRFLPQVCARSTPTTSPSPPSPRAGGLGRRSSMCLHESSGPTRWRNTWVLMWRLLTLALQERCILDGTLTVNYEQVDTEYRLRHNDLLANIVHRYADTLIAKRRPLTQVYNPNPGPGLVRPSGGGAVQHYSTLCSFRPDSAGHVSHTVPVPVSLVFPVSVYRPLSLGHPEQAKLKPPLSLWTLPHHLVWWHNLSFNSLDILPAAPLALA